MPSLNLAPLIAVLGSASVLTDEESRRRRVSSWSPIVLKLRQSGDNPMPDAVALPGSLEEAVTVIEWAKQYHIRILPSGGATSLRDDGVSWQGSIAMDLSNISHIEWDEESLLVTAGAGCRLGSIEEALNRHQYTLGQMPQTLEQMTLGGAIASNAIGFFSGRYGRQRDLTAAIEAVLYDGSVIRTSPTGCHAYRDIHDVLIGAEGAFGVVTEAVLRMRPLPEVRAFAVFSFVDFATAIDATRLIYRSDARPAALRVLDREAATSLHDTPALLLMAFEGDELIQTGNYQLAYAICQQVGGTALSADVGDSWFERRQETSWAGVNARSGSTADILAISAIWSKIKGLENVLRKAISPLVGKLQVELCHPNANSACLEIQFELETVSGKPEETLARHREIMELGRQICIEERCEPFHHLGTRGNRTDAVESGNGSLWKRLTQT